MKKLVCVIAVLCLIVTAAAALAEEAPALNWEDFAPILEASGVSGEFYTFDEVAVKIWLPEGMYPVELTEEDQENGFIGYFMPEDESGAVSVVYVDVNGMSLEEYGEYLASEAGATEIEVGTVNGFPCVSYTLPEQDSVSVTFTTEAGYALEVTCTPLSVENADLVWGAVIASIQAE
jgi:hypothetical protein